MNTQQSIVEYMNASSVRSNIEKTLAERTPQFITTVASLVNESPELQKCDQRSVLAACLTASAINLPVTPGLGMAYIVPHNSTKNVTKEVGNGKQITVKEPCKVAQFQIGWKGLIQLALRTKRYKHINVTEVKQGEYAGKNRLTGEDNFTWIDDEQQRDELKTIGYVAYFELLEGFSKTHYLTTEKITDHAKRYSQSFRAGYGNWKDDFDAMAKKTVLKLLIDKYGPKNQELEIALQADQSSVVEDAVYVDNPRQSTAEIAQEKENARQIAFISAATTITQLEEVKEYITDESVQEKYDTRRAELLIAEEVA